MNDALILKLLKIDLGISATQIDEFLEDRITAAKNAIKDEGIKLEGLDSAESLVEMYAAHLYRTRKDPESKLPRNLRWMMNNILMNQNGKGDE